MATDPRLARAPAGIGTPRQPPPPPPPPEASTQQRRSGGLDGADDGSTNGFRRDDGGFKLKFCTVCASNQNRCVDGPLLESVRSHNIQVEEMRLLSPCRVAVIPESQLLLSFIAFKLLPKALQSMRTQNRTYPQEPQVHRPYLNRLQCRSHPLQRS